MRMFEGKHKENKHWCIVLEKSVHTNVDLCAVDEHTGDHITILIVFSCNGEIKSCRAALHDLKRMGYNPYEHNNEFDDEGRIVISTSNE